LSKQILTITSAEVPVERAGEVVSAYHAMLAQDFPDGLLRTDLVHDGQGRWAIHTLWRDQAAIDDMRAGSQPPAAPALFRNLGAEPTLTILTVEATST
jgi:heme-degrading monooxygenase HmoA